MASGEGPRTDLDPPRPPARPVSPWSPFRHPTFTVLWAATVAANIGTWMYTAASGWLMTGLNPDPLIVSLVQVAASLPVFMFALPAGARPGGGAFVDHGARHWGGAGGVVGGAPPQRGAGPSRGGALGRRRGGGTPAPPPQPASARDADPRRRVLPVRQRLLGAAATG